MTLPPKISRLKAFRPSGIGLAAGVAAGLAAVLLSMLTLQHPPATLLMGFVSPLPLLIASMAFGPVAGAVAVVTGTIFIAIFDLKLGHLVVAENGTFGAAGIDALVFFLGLGLPCWLLAGAALLPAKPAREGVPHMRPDEVRLARVLLIATLFAIVSVIAVFAVAISVNGGLAAFNASMIESFETIWKTIGETRQLPKSVDVHQFAVQLNTVLPPMMSAAAVVFYVVNLWLAARIARTSGMFAKDWPDIPRNLRLPRAVALALAVFLGLSVTGGLFGLASRIVAAALIAAFSLQGLAVAHALTRGKTWRLAGLVLVYLGIFALLPWPLLLWGLVGLLDTAFSFRDRQTPAVVKTSDKAKERKDPWK